jgi:hypothetical protein
MVSEEKLKKIISRNYKYYKTYLSLMKGLNVLNIDRKKKCQGI